MSYTRISFSLYCESAQFEKVVTEIGLQPTKVIVEGDLISPLSINRVHERSCLVYRVERRGDEQFVETMIEFMEMLVPYRQALVALKDRFEVDVRIAIRCPAESGRSIVPWIYFEVDQLEFAAQIGASIDIDVI